MSIMQWLRRATKRAPAAPLRFPTTGFETFGADVLLEEETLEEYRRGLYYPVRLGELIQARYQVVGKFGFGTTSTAWLAKDLQAHKYVALKVYTYDREHDEEFETCQAMNRLGKSHPGSSHIRSAMDTFTIEQTSGANHRCLVQRPMWDSLTDLLDRNPTRRFTIPLLKAALTQTFLALDFLHTECKLVHTDIKGDNLLQEIADQSILDDFVKDELEDPSPRKEEDGVTIYASRAFGLPKKFGKVVLSDFGSAVRGDEEHWHDAQPDVYRSPEVMLKTKWSYPIDIWNVGVMIWDLFEGRHLFYGRDPDGTGYSTRAHLAEVVAILGPPPPDLLQRGRRSNEFFSDGKFIAEVPVPKTTLAELETNLEGTEQDRFLTFMQGMLRWRPEDRKTAKQLLEDPWLRI
ncbi:Serine/threonine-protein kinase SRPK [Pseudocercospora fuligena]|uniref:Serine/threonine-protein kinase SRPK n=1 Tax=Pseudocercospora fuligena TaxID=685502 RepID=A0A8H6VI05_9PEZI|nr:Serine/threonine-protein kinase SRPK [Pseudocercospora fuligena]